jgi:putative ABC transport system substrate-binding protein
MATELVRLKVEVIVVAGTNPAAAARQATNTIPIVVRRAGDLVGAGLVASLAHPGGNVTGLSGLGPELSGKKLELLKEAFPKVSRIAVLWNPTNASNALSWTETPAAGRSLSVQLQSLEVRAATDFDGAFGAATREHADALFVTRDSVTNNSLRQIVVFAAKNRLPAMYPTREYVEDGGLMAYGPDYVDMDRRSAWYVDKILKGAKPADLPIEQPTKFEFIINLKAAKQIGLTIPPNVLARADRVIR